MTKPKNDELTHQKTGRFLNAVEKVGNKLPDPAILFALLMVTVWVISWILSGVSFAELDPRTGKAIEIKNLLSGAAFTEFTGKIVTTFVNFPPLGVVLVAMLGLGIAEYSGFLGAAIRSALSITPKKLLTPAVVLIGAASSVAIDAGYVLVIPLGGVIFYAAGRHPLAGIAAAFAGVSGGFSATIVPGSLDPLLAGLTQASARLAADPGAASIVINPLNNYIFTTASTLLLTLVGWFITDRVIEPRLRTRQIDADITDLPRLEALSSKERKGLIWAVVSMLAITIAIALWLLPETSPWRSEKGALTSGDAPLMKSIVPIIFVVFLLPGLIYGFITGSLRSHRDAVKGLTHSMNGMSYYLVMIFFCSLFVYAFAQSNIGSLLALKGATLLKEWQLPQGLTLVGIVLVTAFLNLLIGSASAKWALIGAVMVPMLMQLGISPDLTQAAYRVGDSSTNIITPLMPYFPLVVVYCQKYLKSTGIGTLVSIMLPYSLAFLVTWTLFLFGFWFFDIPLGVGSSYAYPAS